MLRLKNIGVSSKILLVMILGGWLLNGCGGEQLPSSTLVISPTITPTQTSTQNNLAISSTIAQASTSASSTALKVVTPSLGLPSSTPDPASLKLVYTSPVVAETVGSVRAIAFSPDGQIIATGTNYGVIILRESRTGKEIRRFQYNFAEIQTLAFSPDGEHLVSGNSSYPFTPNIEPGLVIEWEVSSGKLLKIIGYYSNVVDSAAYRADGKLLATIGTERAPNPKGQMSLWKVTGGDLFEDISFEWPPNGVGGISAMAFSPDGNILALSLTSTDNSIILWDTSAPALPSTLKVIKTLNGYTGGVLQIAFSPDSKILASANGDNSIKLWQISTDKLLATFTGHTRLIETLNYSPDGKLLATTSLDQTLKLWRITSSGGHEVFSTVISAPFVLNDIAFSPDGKTLATGDLKGSIKLWEIVD